MIVGALMMAVGLTVVSAASSFSSGSSPEPTVQDLCDALLAAETALADADPFDLDRFDPGYIDAHTALINAAADACEWEEVVDVVASDHDFEGIPGELGAVETLFNLYNQGDEIHEIYIGRINDDAVGLPIEEILANPEEHTSGVAYTQAEPGEASSTVADLTPGSFVAACFIPEGTVPDEAQPGVLSIGDGPPHWEADQYEVFEVT